MLLLVWLFLFGDVVVLICLAVVVLSVNVCFVVIVIVCLVVCIFGSP